MHNVLSSKNRLRGALLAFIAVIASCQDPNTITGPNVITTPGNGSGTALLSQRDRVVNGFQLEPPQYDGVSGNVTFNGKPPIIDMNVYRRTQFKTNMTETTLLAQATIDTAFAPQRAYINIAEQTLELQDVTPSPRRQWRDFSMLRAIVWNGVQHNALPSGKLQTNFYIDPVQLEENSIELPPSVQLTSPTLGAVIDRKEGITLRWNTPLTYDSKTMFAEAVIVGNVKDSYPTANAPSTGKPLLSAIKRIAIGATSISFSREEMSGLPADHAAVAINLYAVKPFRNNTITLRAHTHSFVQIELK
ncbi:MAG: hypothetical protein JNN25_11250 [Candidatus Kapabacteria bacterium]|nr:hypothetical protein [Candidatus Kapabacteria bacterium]